MLQLNITCDTLEEARIYLNALQYYSLISDLSRSLRNAYKHGTEGDVARTITNFLPDLDKAVENSQGAY